MRGGETIVYESTSALKDSTVIKPELVPDSAAYKNLR
jgi:hypothetical protein